MRWFFYDFYPTPFLASANVHLTGKCISDHDRKCNNPLSVWVIAGIFPVIATYAEINGREGYHSQYVW